MKAWVTYTHRLEEQVYVTLMFAGGPFCITFTHATQKFTSVLFSLGALLMQSAETCATEHG